MLKGCMIWDGKTGSIHANILEPQGPTILAVQKLLSVGEPSSNAARALRAGGTIEEGYMLVTNVSEPDVC
jgi:hypothetical protein